MMLAPISPLRLRSPPLLACEHRELQLLLAESTRLLPLNSNSMATCSASALFARPIGLPLVRLVYTGVLLLSQEILT